MTQFTSLFGARLSEKMQLAMHSPWLRLPVFLAILADRGFRNCQRFYARYNKYVQCVGMTYMCVCSWYEYVRRCPSVCVGVTSISVHPCGQAPHSSSHKVGHLAPAKRG